jgi:AcrR family transcriptional regulator
VRSVGRADDNKRDKLERILHAGRQLLSRHGFAGTNMDDVAAQAGVSKGAVYFHVGSKAGLLNRVFEADFTGWIAEAFLDPPDGSLVDQLVGVYGRLLTLMCSQPELTRVYMADAGGGDQHGRATDAMVDLLGRTAGLLDAAKTRGELDDGVRSDQLAYNLWALYFVEQHRWLLDQPDRRGDIDQRLRRPFLVALGGYLHTTTRAAADAPGTDDDARPSRPSRRRAAGGGRPGQSVGR